MCPVSSAGERRFYTATVGGSIPSPGTKFIEDHDWDMGLLGCGLVEKQECLSTRGPQKHGEHSVVVLHAGL
jgi:hypothetical protein